MGRASLFVVRSRREFARAGFSKISWELIRRMCGAAGLESRFSEISNFKNFRFEIGIPEFVKAVKVHHPRGTI
jgi:hypothetical protein